MILCIYINLLIYNVKRSKILKAYSTYINNIGNNYIENLELIFC